MTQLIDRIIEGGAFFTFPIVILFITIIVLIVRGIILKKNAQKIRKLIGSLGLFTVVWGVLGQVLGLIEALDTLESIEAVSFGIIANGLKFTFLPTLFALITFLIARVGIIILDLRSEEKSVESIL